MPVDHAQFCIHADVLHAPAHNWPARYVYVKVVNYVSQLHNDIDARHTRPLILASMTVVRR